MHGREALAHLFGRCLTLPHLPLATLVDNDSRIRMRGHVRGRKGGEALSVSWFTTTFQTLVPAVVCQWAKTAYTWGILFT